MRVDEQGLGWCAPPRSARSNPWRRRRQHRHVQKRRWCCTDYRSYVDFIILSYIMFAYNLPLPHIAAGEDFMGMGSMTEVLRKCGAFFIRRSFGTDKLYSVLVKVYMQRLMMRGHMLEFFIEEHEAAPGKQLEQKMELLAMCSGART